VEGDVVHAAQVAIEHRGHAAERLRVELAVLDDADPAAALGDEDPAVRQEREPVRVAQPFERHDAEFRPGNLRTARSAGSAVEDLRRIGQRCERQVALLRLLRHERGAARGKEQQSDQRFLHRHIEPPAHRNGGSAD
jgi:hypothetical protein